MKKFHFNFRVTGKEAKDMLIDMQAELTKAHNGEDKNQPTMPFVVNYALTKLAKILKTK